MTNIKLLGLLLFAVVVLAGCDSSSNQSADPVQTATTNEVKTSEPQVAASTNDAATVVTSNASNYLIDTKGAHAFINAKFKHLGYSVLWATFKKFDGTFQYDADDISKSSVNVSIDVASIDSNHAKRDEHMRSSKYLDTATYPTATFTSTSIKDVGDGKIHVSGDLNLHGVTKAITFEAELIGEGKDPWGGYRVGLQGKYTLAPAQFGMTNFRPGSVDLELYIEGIKQ